MCRRIVADLDRHGDFVGQLLQLDLPQRERALLDPPQSAVIISSRMPV